MSYNPVLDLPKSQMYRDMTALGIYDLDNGTLVRCEMRACQYGFQLLRELLDRLEQDWWPLSCSQERLEEWEGLLGIPPRPEASPEARRKGVLALLALGEPNRTPAGAAELLAAVGIIGEVEEDIASRRLRVRVAALGEGYRDAGECIRRARELLPAHLTVELEEAAG